RRCAAARVPPAPRAGAARDPRSRAVGRGRPGREALPHRQRGRDALARARRRRTAARGAGGLRRHRSRRSFDRRVERGRPDGERGVLHGAHGLARDLGGRRTSLHGLRTGAAALPRGDAEALGMIDPVAILRELVAIDSTSTRSNLPMLDALERHARALGFGTRRQLWTDAAGVAKGNLIAQRGGEQGGLALVGHTDCVPFDPAWEGALRPALEEGKLFGRGAADTKSFLAAMLSAASRTQAAPLQLVFTADEEVGCLGAHKLAEEGALRPARAVIGEPTRMTPVLGHKGYCLAQVTVKGAEGHSAYPETGASAILSAGRLLVEIERIANELR